jgi:hypothetical protein
MELAGEGAERENVRWIWGMYSCGMELAGEGAEGENVRWIWGMYSCGMELARKRETSLGFSFCISYYYQIDHS